MGTFNPEERLAQAGHFGLFSASFGLSLGSLQQAQSDSKLILSGDRPSP
jgi:hypothetical protein